MIRTVHRMAALLLAGMLAGGCGGGGGGGGGGGSVSGGGSGGDTVPPAITYTTPANSATNVGTNSKVTITFSEAMSLASLGSAITLIDTGSGQPVLLQPIVYDTVNNIATVAPQPNALLANHTYQANVSTAAKDLAGNPLSAGYSWTFTTAVGPGTDVTAPNVTSVAPANTAVGVGTNTSVALTFSEPMDVTTLTNAFTLKAGPTLIPCMFSYIGQAAVFTPLSDLTPGTLYTAEITTAATDLAGNSLAAFPPWSFTTGPGKDLTPPQNPSPVSPLDGATGVSKNTQISATFNEAIYPFLFGTIDGKPAEVSIDYATNTVTMTPAAQLIGNRTYTGSIQLKDLAGNRMAAPFQWSFTTGP